MPLLVRHFVQRRIRAGFGVLAARESRLRNLVVRLSPAQQPNSRQEGKTHNERQVKEHESLACEDFDELMQTRDVAAVRSNRVVVVCRP